MAFSQIGITGGALSKRVSSGRWGSGGAIGKGRFDTGKGQINAISRRQGMHVDHGVR